MAGLVGPTANALSVQPRVFFVVLWLFQKRNTQTHEEHRGLQRDDAARRV